MTKTEEQAKEWSDNHFDEDYRGAAFISYVKGADDQRSIDIDNACEWIKSHSGEVYDDNLGCVLYVIDLDEFRNAMNEPQSTH